MTGQGMYWSSTCYAPLPMMSACSLSWDLIRMCLAECLGPWTTPAEVQLCLLPLHFVETWYIEPTRRDATLIILLSLTMMVC